MGVEQRPHALRELRCRLFDTLPGRHVPILHRSPRVGQAPDVRERHVSSLPLLTYSAPGGLRQGPPRAAESSPEARTCTDRACGNGGGAVHVVLSTDGWRGDVEPLARLERRSRPLDVFDGAEVIA